MDTWIGGMHAIDMVRKRIIGTGPVDGRFSASGTTEDVVVFTRPDVVLSHAISFERMYGRRFAMYFAHNGRRPGIGNDPTEVFAAFSHRVWADVLSMCRPSLRANGTGYVFCHQQYCRDRSIDPIAEAPEYVGAEIYYGTNELGVSIQRISASNAKIKGLVCINGPCARVDGVKGVLDMSRNVLPFASRCSADHTFPIRKALILHRVAASRTDLRPA